jgi:hypothetical protein
MWRCIVRYVVGVAVQFTVAKAGHEQLLEGSRTMPLKPPLIYMIFGGEEND